MPNKMFEIQQITGQIKDFFMKYNNFITLCSIVLCLNTAVSYAYVQKRSCSNIITRMGAEATYSFDDNWKFARFGLQADGTSLNEPDNLQGVNISDANWRKLDLPHDWAIEGPFRPELKGETAKLPYKGIGWYRKSFEVSIEDKSKRLYIDFDGAMANAKIWLNGEYVGSWPYGYTSFRLDLTPFIKFGQNNILAVRLDTEKWDSRWYSGAGIYRHVWLVKTNNVHVSNWGTFITTPTISTNRAKVNIDLKVENKNSYPVSAKLKTTIYSFTKKKNKGELISSFETISILLSANSTTNISNFTNIKNPKLWSISNPNRYIAETEVEVNGKVVDVYRTVFGIRTIEFTARNGFILNGERIHIKGVCNHHDLGALGAAINTSALKRQLLILKELGCNSIRTSHNPPAPDLLELADEMGFLIMVEAFDTWKRGKREWDYNKLFDSWHEKDLVAMVQRDRNHPSVFCWSIGNEVMDQRNPEMTERLADIVRREDPTRPVTNGYNDPNGARSVGSPVSLDIMGVNYFFSRQAEWDKDPRYSNKPTIGTETSSCVSSRGEYFFGVGKEKEYKNWQITSYDTAKPGWGCTPDDQFRTNNKYPHLLGEYVWTGFDYLGEPTPYNSDETNLLNFRSDPEKRTELEKMLEEIKRKNPPSRSSYFGIVDLCGFPKDRYYIYQAHWRPETPMVHILPHWNWKERFDSITPIHVYTSGDEAELFINGISYGRKTKKAGQDYRLVWDNVKYSPGTVRVIAYKNGKKWAANELKTTGKAFKLKLKTKTRKINSNGVDLVFVEVDVVDKNGLMVPRSNQSISFSIEGPGQIVATDNGDATSFVSFRSHVRNAFNGKALVIVKANKGSKGKITLMATSKGLKAAKIKISIVNI